MRVTVCKALRCPRCGSTEMHPTRKVLLIRANKVCDDKGRWWSQCLVCADYYNDRLQETSSNYTPTAGWF